MFKELWNLPSNKLPDEAGDWVRKEFAAAIMTVKEITEKYHLSQPTVSRLYTKHQWPFAFKKGSQLLFITEFAVPWFEQYQDEQNTNRSKESLEAKPKKMGRPKKDKSEYSYTLFGTEYTSNEPLEVVWDKWKDYIASQYPQYYNGPSHKNFIVELQTKWPIELTRSMTHIDDTFRKLKYSDKKSASGKSK